MRSFTVDEKKGTFTICGYCTDCAHFHYDGILIVTFSSFHFDTEIIFEIPGLIIGPLLITNKLITQNCTDKIADYNQPLYQHGWTKIVYYFISDKNIFYCK